MEHISLYRKYRPQNFDEIIGQDHIVNLLKESIKNNNIVHAYVFAGTRGTGKTSIARIFAKEIGTHENDLYEIDAASNTGVDDIRILNESVYVLPFSSKYKIYLLDEAHMLSKSAFNALLKTIEEPPAHVIFILATTEIDKLPDTILSRCQVLQFNKPNKGTLIKTIKNVCDKEKINMPKSAMEVIALLGDGSFRDTLGILQKVISTCTSPVITLEDVNNITGSPKATLINEFIHALNNKDTERALEVISEVISNNSSITLFSRIVLERIRTILLSRFAPKVAEEIMKDYSEEEIVTIKSIANKKDSGINSKALSEILKAHQDIKHSPLPFIPLEMSVIALNEKI